MRPALLTQGRVAVASAKQDVELVLLEQFLVTSNASERSADELEQCAYAWHTFFWPSRPSRELDYLTYPIR